MKCLALIRAAADVRPLTAVGGVATVEVDHEARKKKSSGRQLLVGNVRKPEI